MMSVEGLVAAGRVAANTIQVSNGVYFSWSPFAMMAPPNSAHSCLGDSHRLMMMGA
jgi:hypothetical protein